MVFTLHRYVFRELLKVFVLAAVALTLMLSLGCIIRPVQEYGVGPQQVIHLIGYFLPITLTFVLPMAALFSASLVYGRLAGDNEIDACRASGISLLTLIYPGLALAIVVAIANLILSFYVTPAFVQRAEKSFKADAKQIFFRNIQRRGFYELRLEDNDMYLIYADHADPGNDTLWGVVVAELKGREITRTTTVQRAWVKFIPHRRLNEVRITAQNMDQMSSENQGWFSMEQGSISTEFGSLMTDSIKFKNIDEMKQIQADPMQFYPIEKLARATYAQFAAELLAKDISGKIADSAGSGKTPPAGTNGGQNGCELHSAKRLVRFTAENCRARDQRNVELSGQVVVAEYDVTKNPPSLLRIWRCGMASLEIEGNEFAPTLKMYLRNPRWQQPDGREYLAQRHKISGLMLPEAVDKLIVENLKGITPTAVAAALQTEPSAPLKALQNRLQTKINKALAGIKAEIHFRLVFGIGCVSLIMIGIGLGIIKKDGHLLTAFGTSCLPAGMLLVCLLMGKNVAKNPGSQAISGVTLMWAGLVFLSVLALTIYHRLIKN